MANKNTQKLTHIKTLRGLETGATYRIHESKVPTGFQREPNGDVVFKVDANGNAKITSNSGDMDGTTIQVLNAPLDFLWGNKYPKRYPEESGKKKETEKQTKKQTETEEIKKTVKTGDETPIMQWVLILLVGAAGIGGAGTVLAKKRRKRS